MSIILWLVFYFILSLCRVHPEECHHLWRLHAGLKFWKFSKSKNIQSTLGNVQSTVGNIQSTLGNIQFTLGNTQSTLGNIQFTLGNI
jgi:hypothetical protein